MSFRTLGVALSVALAATAQAQSQPPAPDAPLLLVGVGGGAEQLPYQGAKTRARVLPLIVYENDWLAVSLPSVDLKLPSLGPIQLRLRTRFGFDGYKAKDATGLAGMAERKNGLWLGPAAVWGGEWGELSLEATAEATRYSKGRQWQLQYEYPLQLGALSLTPRVGLNGQDRRYTDYYFGVRAEEALPTRARYSGEAGRQTQVGLRASYRLSPQSMLFVDVSANRLSDSAARSPLVERRNTGGVFAGWLYRM